MHDDVITNTSSIAQSLSYIILNFFSQSCTLEQSYTLSSGNDVMEFLEKIINE